MAHQQRPPGPQPAPLLGNLLQLNKDPLDFLTTCARRYGDVASYQILNTTVYLLSCPDDIETVLLSHAKNFHKGRVAQASRVLFGNGLLLSEGEYWLRQRRLAQPAFNRERIAIYAESVIEYTEQMLTWWKAGTTLDIHQAMVGLTMRIAARALFGAHMEHEVESASAALGLFFEKFQKQVRAGLIIPGQVPTPGNLELRRAIRRLDEIIYRIIQARRLEPEVQGDLLSTLLHAKDQDGKQMTDKQLRDEVITLFIGGHETTAIALAWTLYLLAQSPEADARLAAELEEVLGGGAPRLQDLPNLPYAEMVVKEALRLYPPAWALTRVALEDIDVGGYPIRAGTSVTMSQWVVHHDPRYFTAPEQFQPERWTEAFEKSLPRFAYFPFGGGPRVCIGSSFGMVEVALVLARVMQQFRMRLAPGQKIDLLPSIVLRPRHGIRMELGERTKAN